ncbi:tol-pal system protein YbgF [Candidatus Latescibacterota bacterium]
MSLLLVSCATQKDMLALNSSLESRNAVVDARFDNIESSLGSIQSMLNEQKMLSMDIRALMGTQESEQRDMIASIMARQDDINYQLRELLNKLQAIQLYGGISAQAPPAAPIPLTSPSTEKKPAIVPPGTPGSAAAAVKATEANAGKAAELFDAAVADINQGNHVLAESRLLTFLIQYPTHERAGDAQFFLGKVSFDQKKYDLAVTEIGKLIKQFPKSPRIPAALLMKGVSEIETGKTKSAATTLKKLVSSYPKSDEAKQAKEKLDAL